MIRALKPEELRLRVDPASLEAKTSGELRPNVGLIGQTRATRALRFGLDIADNGFNIYVAGPPGIGKMTAVQAFVEETAKSHPAASDWCYVNNFEDPYRP